MSTIILTGGGTAGHVMPNIALLPKLKNCFDKIIYIGSFDGIERNIIKQYPFIDFYPITTVKLIRKFTLKNLAIPFKLLKGIIEAKHIIKKTKPNIIFSKGGFVSLPVTFAAKKLKVPVVLHESDLTMGLANKLSAKSAVCVLTTFPQTAKTVKNGVFVGAPVKQELFKEDPNKIKQQLKINTPKPILLVVGGSLGSSFLNNMVKQNIDFLTENFFVIHLTGQQQNTFLRHENYMPFQFCNKIEKLYAVCDLAITRGGSNTIWELFSLKIPMLIIPLGKSQSRGDQIENAKYFKEMGFALTLLEKDATNQNLKNALLSLNKNKQKFKNQMANHTNKNSVDKIFNYLNKYAIKKT